MEIVTVAEMREIEREGFEAGTSYEAMVDMVGKAVAAEVDRYPRGLRITGLIGKGNNGADTIGWPAEEMWTLSPSGVAATLPMTEA